MPKSKTELCSAISTKDSVSITTFSVSEEDMAKIAAFQAEVEKERGSSYGGAIGGATTYHFTPTSIGLIFKVTHFGKELDLSDYESW
jgi:hypothetical protein